MTKKENERLAIVETKIDSLETSMKELIRKIDFIIEKDNKQNIEIEKIKTKTNTNRMMFWGILLLVMSIVIKSIL